MKLRVFVLLIILLLLVNLNVFADHELEWRETQTTTQNSDTYNTNGNQDSVDVNVDEEIAKAIEDTLQTSFKEITQDEFLAVISGNTVISATRAGQEYYIKTETDNLRFSGNGNGDWDSFIKVNGIDFKIVSAKDLITSETTTTTKKTSTFFSSGWFLVGGSFLLCILIMLAKKHSMESREVTISSDGEEGIGRRSRKDKDKEDASVPKVKFSDVEGVEGLKADVFRLVDCLKNPTKYDEIGARTPKGVILYGPPGTGKTLLAKAIAGEAGVPFFSAVGSDFVEMYVGVGAKRVRELYKKARKSSPCIVFIDEIDAVASKRGSDNNSEKDQTINALLAELDGFSSKEKIITICATNRLDMLDSAFKRAGRFDLKLAVGLPDKEGRHNILKIHAANKKLAEEVDLEKIAVKCSGFSGAELETLLNEAAMTAVGKGHTEIDNDDIEDAFFKIILQGNKKPRKEIDEMNRIVAWHEAGHTLATKLLTEDSVPSVTIVGSSSGAGGVTFRTPKQEGLQSKKYLRALIGIMYAGRAAEELYQGNTELITTGASQDIQQATSIIKEYLASYGMGNIGMLDMTQLRQDYGDIIEEASELAKEIYGSTLDLLRDNLEKLNALAENLLIKETLYEDEIDAIIA